MTEAMQFGIIVVSLFEITALTAWFLFKNVDGGGDNNGNEPS